MLFNTNQKITNTISISLEAKVEDFKATDILAKAYRILIVNEYSTDFKTMNDQATRSIYVSDFKRKFDDIIFWPSYKEHTKMSKDFEA